jgi:CRP/FNR family transcriptional regulator, polysaccharide utilization system transcription regulator
MPKTENATHCKDCPSFQKSVFHKLSDQSLDLLSKVKEVLTHDKSDPYNVQDSDADAVYCLSHGSAKIFRQSKPSGQPSIVRIAAPGDLLGYRCIFSEKSFRATGSALEETKSCKISKSYFMQMLESDASLSMEVLKRMGQEVSAAENHHHSFCSKNVRERVAESLLILHNKASTQLPIGHRIEIQLTRQEFASWVGTAKATVIRCLAEFKKENLILLQDGYIVLIDIQKLAQIAG